MKKLLCLCMLSCIFYAGCKNSSAPSDVTDTASRVSNPNLTAVDTSKILGRDISPEELKLLVDNFKSYNKPIDSIPLTTSVWFDIKELEDMVIQLRNEQKAGKTKTDGVRIYFGAYSKRIPGGISYSNPGQNTLIFVSTETGLSAGVLDKSKHVNYYHESDKSFEMNPYNRGQLCEPICDDDAIIIPEKSVTVTKK